MRWSAEILQGQYQHIVDLDHQRVKLADQAEHQQLTPETLATFASQMKELTGLLQQFCEPCRTRINQHWLQVEIFNAAALVRFNRPLYLPAHVRQALAQWVSEEKFQKTEE